MSTDISALPPAQLALLTAIQDRLIPRDGDRPGAGEAGGAVRVKSYITEHPEWGADILTALEVIHVAAERTLALRAASVSGGPPTASTSALIPNGDTGRLPFLALTDDERDAVLQGVEASHPRPFQRLLRLTYNAYYTDPSVRRAHGFEPDPPQPGGYAIPPFDESRLDHIKRRGKLWRDA